MNTRQCTFVCMHKVIAPKILYLGSPVVLISTMNEDGSVNLAPMSSVCIEVQIIRVHAEEDLLDAHYRHHICADRWRALIMSFLNVHGLGDQVHGSRLAEVF